jgi:D-arabinose 1-dehydrogenase-like Zn-dependent alcohol dehydrogenase
MEEKFNKILEKHELNVSAYVATKKATLEKMKFMQEHNFQHELEHLRVKRDAINDILMDYQNAIEDLRALLNAWNS